VARALCQRLRPGESPLRGARPLRGRLPRGE